MNTRIQDAYFGAGCFWGVEEYFRKLPGVIETEVGYMGGHTDNPTYETVCGGTTGHAETVHVIFKPDMISFEDLCRKFFAIHNPTTVNRQGHDIGEQYRSVIFYVDGSQQDVAEKVKQEIDEGGTYQKPVVTEIVPAYTFWRAEEYHQQYALKHGGASCHI